jgi:hypothetical protein
MSQQPAAHNFSVDITGPFDFGVATAPPTSQTALDNIKETTPLPASSQVTTSDPAVLAPDWVSIFQAQFRRYDERLAQFEHLLEENLRLRAALEASQQRIAALEADRAVHPKPTSTPPAPTTPKPNEGTSASRWSSPEAVPLPTTATKSFAAVVAAIATPSAPSKASPPVRRRRVTPRQVKAVARTFAPLAADHGYQYVYLPCRFREAYSSLRAKLNKLKINSARVLDVHYPDNHVVALLVHNSYAVDLLDRFGKAGVKPLEPFDPLDTARLRDPSFASLSEEERKTKCVELHQQRLLRALKHIRLPVRLAVARFFHQQEWITKAQYDLVLEVNSASSVNHDTQHAVDDMADVINTFTAGVQASSDEPSGDGEPVNNH